MPVRFVAHQAGLAQSGQVSLDLLSGTVRDGQMRLDGEHLVTWRVNGRASIFRLSLVIGWRVTGPQTDLSGDLALRPAGLSLGPVSGVVGWPLVMGLIPQVAIRCDGQARLDAVEIDARGSTRRASGAITMPGATCNRANTAATDKTAPVAVPALRAELSTTADALQGLIVAENAPSSPLLTARVTSTDRLVLTIHQAGAALVPGMPATADSELDLPLSVLFAR